MLHIRFWETFCQLSPWMLAGTVIAGLIHVFLPENFLRRSLRGPAGVLKSVGLGVPLPLCSCGVIPTGIGLKKNGASDGAAVGFLISTPQTGVDSVLVSAAFLGWPFALFKVVAAAVTGIAGGWIADFVGGKKIDDTVSTESSGRRKGLREFWDHCAEILRSIWIWLLIGVLISALISLYIPQSTFTTVTRWGILPALFLVLLISTPLYVCATASIPIATALVAGGLPPSVALVFLMAGPATNIATITSIYGSFGWKTTTVYLVTIIVGSIAFAVLFDGLITGTMPVTSLHENCQIRWWETMAGIVLMLLFGWFAIQDSKRLFRKFSAGSESADAVQISIEGMNCQSCVEKLEKSIGKVKGVESVQVNLKSGSASLTGNYKLPDVVTAVQDAGFTCQC